MAVKKPVPKAAPAAPPSPPASEKAAAARTGEALAAVKGLSADALATQFTRVQIDVGKRLADAASQATAQVAVLRDVEDAIAARRQELAALYGIEAEAVSLDALRREVAAEREAWAAERAAHAAGLAEERAETDRARRREAEEYAYRQAADRRKAADECAAEVAARKRAEADRQATLEKGWAVREEELKKREAELAALRAAAAAHPEEVRKAVDREVAAATGALRKQLDTEAKLREKDGQTALQLAQAATAAANREVERLGARVAELLGQVEDAHRSARLIAEKALDSASGRASLETLQQSLVRDPTPPAGAGRAGR